MPTSGKIVVPLTETSVLDAGDIGGNLLRGQWEQCGPRPSTDVKAYPKLASDKPLFGTITVGRDERKPAAAAVHREERIVSGADACRVRAAALRGIVAMRGLDNERFH